MTEEYIVENWYHQPLPEYLRYPGTKRNEFLESDEMQGRWCMPLSCVGSKGGIYFEFADDRLLYMLRVGYEND